MPYGNFDDNYATRLVYNEQQNHDPDLTLGEFVFDKLLRIGELFETDDDDDDTNPVPFQSPHPVQSLQIQSGILQCDKPAVKMIELPEPEAKPTCAFRENKISRDYTSPIFHPPAILA
jgi:hypothetical protein